jgi:hypothetical protein
MFLADKYGPLLFPHHRQGKPKPPPAAPEPTAARFDAALAARLRGLLPLPASPLAALARVADVLALTLGDAAAAPALGDAAAVAAHLDGAGTALLDACNAIAARLDRLRLRALRLLPSSDSAPLPPLPFEQPRGRRLSGAARVLAAASAVSSLTAAAAVGGGPHPAAAFPVVSGGDFPWADAFNAVSSQFSALAGEVDAVDEAVEEELTARLGRASDAVNGVFRAALCLRNAEVDSFMLGWDSPCK